MTKSKLLSNKSVQVYVRPVVHEDLKVLSERTGLSISAIAWMAFSEG